MTNKQFARALESTFKDIQKNVVPNPKTRGVAYYKNAYGNWQRGSTGNMAFNATKLEFITDKEADIYVDEKIAPYVPYTNEKWISPKWKGHKNPNEGWFDRMAEYVATELAKKFKGTITR